MKRGYLFNTAAFIFSLPISRTYLVGSCPFSRHICGGSGSVGKVYLQKLAAEYRRIIGAIHRKIA